MSIHTIESPADICDIEEVCIDLKAARELLKSKMAEDGTTEFYKRYFPTIERNYMSRLENGDHDLFNSPQGILYVLRVWELVQMHTRKAKTEFPFIHDFISLLTNNQDIGTIDISQCRDMLNIDQMEMLCKIKENKEIRVMGIYQLRPFRNIFLKEDYPIRRIARDIGCTPASISILERGKMDPMKSCVALRYLMRFVAPKFSTLDPHFIAGRFFELYMLLRTLNTPFGFKAR